MRSTTEPRSIRSNYVNMKQVTPVPAAPRRTRSAAPEPAHNDVWGNSQIFRADFVPRDSQLESIDALHEPHVEAVRALEQAVERGRERRGSPQADEKLRTLAGACGPSAFGSRDGENSVPLTPASGDRSAAVSTSPPTWHVAATSPPTWCVALQVRGLARRSEPARCWRSEPARLQPARRAGAAPLPGGARAPRGPGTRRYRHTRQSLRARQPTARGDEQARGSTRPCRFPKRAQREGHLRPPSRPRGRPVLP
jgi:hypothetical protein